jgi:putative (di)nucleoside polyphosphate hydrolase
VEEIKEEEIELLPYRRGAGLMIVNSALEVFVGRRNDTRTELWQMPQGGIDEGEGVIEAALREMKEETGTDNAKLLAETKNWYHYDLPHYLVPKLWNGKYRGQKQKWLLFKFLGDDSEFDLATHDSVEFLDWKWVKMEELPHIIVPFKKQLYISIIEEFRDVIIELKSQPWQ